ncbi:MAG: N-acetyltransferase [Candidatus Brocadiia bacterium]
MGVRKAQVGDAPTIHALVNACAREELMLPLSRSEVYDRLRDFFVYEREGEVVGCVALHVVWEDLAEVRSLAVRDDARGAGVGRELVAACLAEAPGLGVRRVFTLTFVPGFFRKLGLAETSKEALPHKVWADCVRCPHFPNCEEVALVGEVGPGGELRGPGAGGEG